MKKNNVYLSIIIFVISFSKMYSQEYNSITYKNYTKARQVFDDYLRKSKYVFVDSLNFSVQGNWYYLDHFNIPKKREKAIIKEKVFFNKKNNFTLSLKGETILFGDKYHKNEFYSKDSLVFKDYGEKTNYKKNEINKKSEILMLSPIVLVNDIQENVNTLRYVGFDKVDNSHILSYISSSNKQTSISIDDKKTNIIKSEVLNYDNIQGDFLTTHLYQNYSLIKGLYLPSKLTIKEWGTVKKELKYEYKNIVNNEKTKCEYYTFTKIEDGFYSLSLPTQEHRVFVINFENYLGIIESPIGIKYSKCLYDNIKQRFPNKELKYVFLTHHHPDHAGGVNYFLKKGLTVVSTELSINYFKELLNRKHTIQNNYSFNIEEFGNFEMITSNGRREIKTKNNELQIYEFGIKSLHVDEFLIYYLPKQKSLIISDLWRVPQKGVYASKRALNIYNFMMDEKLTVEKIYQTWPLENFKKNATFEDLKSSAKLASEK